MAEEEKQTYAEYVNSVSSVRAMVLSLLSGFTFTAITILLYELSIPTSLVSNIALLFLAIIFDLLLFLLGWQTYIIIGLYNVRESPRHSRGNCQLSTG